MTTGPEILVWGIFSTFFVIGISLFIQSPDRKKLSKLRHALEECTYGTDIQIDERDVWCDRALGIDFGLKKIIYLSFKEGNCFRMNVDLSDAAEVSVSFESGKLDLIIHSLGEQRRTVKLEMHNSNLDSHLTFQSNELIARKWKGMIDEVISGHAPI